MNASVIPAAILDARNFLDRMNWFGAAVAEKEENEENSESAKREFTCCPKADSYTTESGFTLEVELPGVKKENLDVQLEKNILTVKATRERENEKKNYERNFRLAEDIDTENIQLTLENGILAFAFVKKQQAAPRKLNVA